MRSHYNDNDDVDHDDDDNADDQDNDEDEYLGHKKYGDPLVVSVVQDAFVGLFSCAVTLEQK